MDNAAPRTIRIAAALIDDEAGRLLLVRKAGTQWFMQPGGKIEDGESPLSALRRELGEEIGLVLADEDARHLGRFRASAANEPDHIVEAEVFHVRVRHVPETRLEIEEAILGRSHRGGGDAAGTAYARSYSAFSSDALTERR